MADLVQAAIYLLILVVAVIPVVDEAVTNGNLTGSTAVIAGTFTIFLGLAGLVYVSKTMKRG